MHTNNILAGTSNGAIILYKFWMTLATEAQTTIFESDYKILSIMPHIRQRFCTMRILYMSINNLKMLVKFE